MLNSDGSNLAQASTPPLFGGMRGRSTQLFDLNGPLQAATWRGKDPLHSGKSSAVIGGESQIEHTSWII